jgi:hypothetical protein
MPSMDVFVTQVKRDTEPVDEAGLAAHVASQLPEHMVPVDIQVVDALLLCHNGKWIERGGDLSRSRLMLIHRGQFRSTQQSEHCCVVGGLDRRDRVQADAFIDSMQPFVNDTKTRGGGDIQAREIVADVGHTGNLRLHVDS